MDEVEIRNLLDFYREKRKQQFDSNLYHLGYTNGIIYALKVILEEEEPRKYY